MLFQKCIVLLLLTFFPLSTPSTCSTTDQIKFLQCKGSIIKIQDLLKLYAPFTESPIPAAVFKRISKLCDKAVSCVDRIECVEAKRGVSLMNNACGGIELSSGPFGDCLSKLQTITLNVKKYPCAGVLKKEALDNTSKGCRMFSEDLDCVKNVAKDYCGTEAVDAFRKGTPFMKNLMKCP
ncbi:hypothetical protein CAEBREN_03593 [Caenorhabditis brenneri]|uniref:T20D4.11-like domain-containing protein n=1 Tax=Caenorhabditis brenneri TaxID=135651 RepID=G0NKQ5_CAEBE|nr:hypothetical protein CAEBREN_03593 [Caenorhabditis brenneri]